MHTFTIGGKNMHFHPFFLIPFQSFFSPNLLFGHPPPGWGGGQTEKYTPLLKITPDFLIILQNSCVKT